MSDYSCSYKQISSTVGGMILACCFVTNTWGMETANTLLTNSKLKLYENSINCNVETLNENLAYFNKKSVYNLTDNWFEQAISIFYSRFLANQESIEPELEKIIHENIWDLYES